MVGSQTTARSQVRGTEAGSRRNIPPSIETFLRTARRGVSRIMQSVGHNQTSELSPLPIVGIGGGRRAAKGGWDGHDRGPEAFHALIYFLIVFLFFTTSATTPGPPSSPQINLVSCRPNFPTSRPPPESSQLSKPSPERASKTPHMEPKNKPEVRPRRSANARSGTSHSPLSAAHENRTGFPSPSARATTWCACRHASHNVEGAPLSRAVIVCSPVVRFARGVELCVYPRHRQHDKHETAQGVFVYACA